MRSAGTGVTASAEADPCNKVHPIPKARYHVRNWPAYEAGLRRRGYLTLWIDEASAIGRHKRKTAGWDDDFLAELIAR